ncbi:type II secretion system F family protein [Brevibacterium luteolum]|uniref:type II secretion system F family protein n=1 Tax=Brevibacterium luteolum TaxID=199591 RepID=UPI0038795AAA
MTAVVIALIGGLAATGWWLLSADTAASRLTQLLPTRAGADQSPSRPRLFARWHRQAATASGSDDESAAIAMIDRAAELLRVGMPPEAIMSQLGELSDDPHSAEVLGRMSRSLRLGERPHEAIRRHAGQLPTAQHDIFDGMAAVWFVAETAGAPAADMLARYATSCREKADAARERAVALAGPQSTVRVLTWLPVFSLGLGAFIGANPLRLALTVPGALSLGGGIALLLAGRAWMRAMLRIAQ